MLTLVVATTVDPASIGPASALLAMPGWQLGPSWQDAQSYVNEEVRLIKLDNRLVKEDHLDKRWEEATGESVDEVMFLSKQVASSKRRAFTIHPIGMNKIRMYSTPHIGEGEVLVAGEKVGWAAPPNPRIGPWLRLLRTISASHNLSPEFEVTLEATYHGPVINSPTMFVEIGSMEEYWRRQGAAQAIALLVWQGLGLGDGIAVGDCPRNNGRSKILLGIGGGHYVPRHLDVVLKDGVWVGHLLSGYSLPMEDPIPSQPKVPVNANAVGGTWRESKVAFEATKLALPRGEVLAHLDQKSFKSWQRNAITGFLVEQNIEIGKPSDF